MMWQKKNEVTKEMKENFQLRFFIIYGGGHWKYWSYGSWSEIHYKTFNESARSKLTFSEHISNVVQKSNKMNSALKLIRRKLTLNQFLKVLTSQF